MTVMRSRQSIDFSSTPQDPSAGHPNVNSNTAPSAAAAAAATTHRRSISYATGPLGGGGGQGGHGRRPSQSLGGTATLELIQAQAASAALGGDQNPIAFVNQVAASNQQQQHQQQHQHQQQQQQQQVNGNGNIHVNLDGHLNGTLNGNLAHTAQDLSHLSMMHPGGPTYLNNFPTQGMDLNSIGMAAAQLGVMQMNQNMNVMNGFAGVGPGIGGPARRGGRMSTGPGQVTGPTGMYPFGHMGMNPKLQGMNGMQHGRLPGTLPNGQMDPAQMTGNYGPAAAAAAAAAAGNTTGRTVYVGNLPPDASVDELMNLVRFGPVESVRLLPEKSCVFISFLDGATAAAFHADATVKKLTLHGQELKIGWGKPSIVPPPVVQAIAVAKATRNVYLGGLDEVLTESELRDDLSRFGPIDQVKIVKDKGIGFVHFLSIGAAMKVVATLPTEQEWQGKRIGYGKDRCAYVPRAQQAAVQAAQQQAAAALGHTLGMPGAPFQAFNPLSPATLYSSNFHSPVSRQTGFENQDPYNNTMSNRCVYIGSLPEEATTSDICDAIRGGLVAQIRYLQDKHYAFVTFADPNAAATFYQQATSIGLMIHNTKVKISWGRSVGHVSPAVMANIASGGTRNVYIGNIEDFEKFTEEKLRQDFGEFGEIEQINFLASKKAAFVNYCAVGNASKAIERIRANADYANCRISYGKDRCANPPKQGHFGVTPRNARVEASPAPQSQEGGSPSAEQENSEPVQVKQEAQGDEEPLKAAASGSGSPSTASEVKFEERQVAAESS